MAKGIAWSGITCQPPALEVRLNPSVPLGEQAAIQFTRARALERVFARAAATHAALSLLLDAMDIAGEMEPDDLVEPYSAMGKIGIDLADQDYVASLGVVESRKHYPLSNLKARVGMLVLEATKGDFQIPAGAISCVGPALEEAKALLDVFIPTVELAGTLTALRTQGLYRVLDGQALLLALAADSQQ